ncbi:MAG: hypothetical protein Kow0068_13450 [Marinilabiliales bacterium]
MKQFKWIIIPIIIAAYISVSFDDGDDKNWNDCVEKYKSEWGQPIKGCTYNNKIYKAYYRNICDENIDVLISTMNKDNVWECFYKENMAPNDTLMIYTCNGTGSTLIWVKKAGDKEIVFPTCEEVNNEY